MAVHHPRRSRYKPHFGRFHPFPLPRPLICRNRSLKTALWGLNGLFILWMINLYNFMDGMDGFAGGMAVIGFIDAGLAGAR